MIHRCRRSDGLSNRRDIDRLRLSYSFSALDRESDWNPAIRAAGLEHRSPYALRHSYASFAIAAGVSMFELARFMGTSVAVIDRTYGHLPPDARDRAKLALDSFVALSDEALASEQ